MNNNRITTSLTVTWANDLPKFSKTLYSSRMRGRLINEVINPAIPKIVECLTYFKSKIQFSKGVLRSGKLVKIYGLIDLSYQKKETAKPWKTVSEIIAINPSGLKLIIAYV